MKSARRSRFSEYEAAIPDTVFMEHGATIIPAAPEGAGRDRSESGDYLSERRPVFHTCFFLFWAKLLTPTVSFASSGPGTPFACACSSRNRLRNGRPRA